MTKRDAHSIALRLAYNAVEKALDTGGNEAENDQDQEKIEQALDAIAQSLYNRWSRMMETTPTGRRVK